MKSEGWTCKTCYRKGNDFSSNLYGFDRLCYKCAKDSPIPAPVKTAKVTIPEFIEAVRGLVPYWFAPFHLSPCHQCNHPCWGQPCRWCGFYPYGQYPKADPEKYLGKDRWLKSLEKQEFILHYIAGRFNNCASTSVNNHWMDKALDAAKIIEWPTALELWEAFGPDADKDARDALHPWRKSNSVNWTELRRKELEGELEFFQWCKDTGNMGYGDSSRLDQIKADLARMSLKS